MKRKIILAILCVIVVIALLSIGINYLNKVILPTKIKALIVNTLEQETGKKVSLESVQFNIFRGLVLTNFTISDENRRILDIKQASCNFFLPALIKKQVVITRLSLSEAEAFLERKTANSFNLQEFLPQKKSTDTKKGFSFFISRVALYKCKVLFQDDTTTPQFAKSFENVNASVAFSFPASVKFTLNAEIPENPPAKIVAQGDFKIPQQQFSGKLEFKELPLKDFQAYYQQSGIAVGEGRADAKFNFDYKNSLAQVEADILSRDISLEKGKLSAKLGATLRGSFQYNVKEKKLKFDGNANILKMDLSGLEFVGEIKEIRGPIKFNETQASAENLTATCLGLGLDADLSLAQYNDPVLTVKAHSSPSVEVLRSLLKEKWQIEVPAQITGNTALSVDIKLKPLAPEAAQINGALKISDATIKPDQLNAPLKNVNGVFQFTQNQLKWEDFSFDYLTVPYKSSGVLTNFQAPGVQFELSSRQLFLESVLAINHKLVKLSKFRGRFNNSDFTVSG
ncbi:MAG: DUF748 domain-containing protein, partial [Candidatus Omnitrophica bacterium]|nr:DUF748 domain-containing protein [Candidatus Omnitrophota bacterium]